MNKMGNALQIVKTVLMLVPALIQAIKAIEEAIPGQGQGEMKLAAVRQIIEDTYEQSAMILPAITSTIGVLVNLFNKTGTFQK